MLKLYRDQSSRLRSLQRYAAIATNSEYLASEYRRHGLHAQCLYLFAESWPQGPSSAAPQSDVWRLLFVGRMDRLKGGSVLLQALPEIRSSTGRRLEVIFIGDGPERQAWQESARRIEAANPGIHVEFKGWLEKSELAREFSRAGLLVVPSLWPEPFGLVGIEAGLHGVPAVAFSVGGIPEWLKDGENGYLAPGNPPATTPLARAIAQALDPSNYQRLRAGARRLASGWTIEKHCDQLDKLLEQTVRKNPHSGVAAHTAGFALPG
jgi:glycosyltransferase involved in cell wall biosynthesis